MEGEKGIVFSSGYVCNGYPSCSLCVPDEKISGESTRRRYKNMLESILEMLLMLLIALLVSTHLASFKESLCVLAYVFCH